MTRVPTRYLNSDKWKAYIVKRDELENEPTDDLEEMNALFHYEKTVESTFPVSIEYPYDSNTEPNVASMSAEVVTLNVLVCPCGNQSGYWEYPADRFKSASELLEAKITAGTLKIIIKNLLKNYVNAVPKKK